nr:PREDICTED: forkhead box protein E3-like [Lepisosteus oculatus]
MAGGGGGRDPPGLSFSIENLLFDRGAGRAEPPPPGPEPLSDGDAPRPQSRGAPGGEAGEGEEEGGAERGGSSSDGPQDKPGQSYIALISTAILASRDKKLLLCDIYQWIMDNYPYFKSKDKNWRNSVRHNLSLNECFVKAGRSDSGKGHYWAIHPANYQDFSKGDYHRRRARRRIRRVAGQLACPLLPPAYLPHRPGATPCWCCPPPYLPCLPARVYWSWAALPAPPGLLAPKAAGPHILYPPSSPPPPPPLGDENTCRDAAPSGRPEYDQLGLRYPLWARDRQRLLPGKQRRTDSGDGWRAAPAQAQPPSTVRQRDP